MTQENSPLNQFSQENKPSENFSPASLIKYVQDNEDLPELNQEELEEINNAMTQKEVLEYHITVKTLQDQDKKKELLDRWVPKPKILFHSSRTEGIKEFEPRNVYKRSADDPPQVYGASSEAVAAMMMAPGGDEWSKSGSYDGGKTWTFIYTDAEDFKKEDNGGYIYELPPDDFECNPHIGLGVSEWTSTKPVKPLSEPRHYSSSIEVMLKYGVKVYEVDRETFGRFRGRYRNDTEILKNLKPIE